MPDLAAQLPVALDLQLPHLTHLVDLLWARILAAETTPRQALALMDLLTDVQLALTGPHGRTAQEALANPPTNSLRDHVTQLLAKWHAIETAVHPTPLERSPRESLHRLLSTVLLCARWDVCSLMFDVYRRLQELHLPRELLQWVQSAMEVSETAWLSSITATRAGENGNELPQLQHVVACLTPAHDRGAVLRFLLHSLRASVQLRAVLATWLVGHPAELQLWMAATEAAATSSAVKEEPELCGLFLRALLSLLSVFSTRPELRPHLITLLTGDATREHVTLQLLQRWQGGDGFTGPELLHEVHAADAQNPTAPALLPGLVDELLKTVLTSRVPDQRGAELLGWVLNALHTGRQSAHTLRLQLEKSHTAVVLELLGNPSADVQRRGAQLWMDITRPSDVERAIFKQRYHLTIEAGVGGEQVADESAAPQPAVVSAGQSALAAPRDVVGGPGAGADDERLGPALNRAGVKSARDELKRIVDDGSDAKAQLGRFAREDGRPQSGLVRTATTKQNLARVLEAVGIKQPQLLEGATGVGSEYSTTPLLRSPPFSQYACLRCVSPATCGLCCVRRICHDQGGCG